MGDNTPTNPLIIRLRILISRLSAHGDIIQTLPLLNTLRQAYPEAYIGWLVEPAGLPLLEAHPQLDAVHAFPLKRLKQHLADGQLLQAKRLWQHTIHAIKTVNYTHSIDPQGLLKSAVVPWLAGIPNRIGFDKTRECAAWFYTTRMPPHDMKNPYKPTVDWFNELALGMGLIILPPTQYVLPVLDDSLLARVQARLQSLPRPIIALAPGTIWPSKQWPHWPQLMAKLASQSVVILGSSQEAVTVSDWLANVFPDGMPARWQNWTGQTDWPTLQAVLTCTDRFIGPDSAPLHLANAVGFETGRPRIIGLYGPTAPRRTGPINPRYKKASDEGDTTHHCIIANVPCQPCFKRQCPLTGDAHLACMRDLNPQQLMDQLAEWGNT